MKATHAIVVSLITAVVIFGMLKSCSWTNFIPDAVNPHAKVNERCPCKDPKCPCIKRFWVRADGTEVEIDENEKPDPNAPRPLTEEEFKKLQEELRRQKAQGSAWRKGPLPPGTFMWGGVVLKGEEKVTGFHFADFKGDKVLLIGEGNKGHGFCPECGRAGERGPGVVRHTDKCPNEHAWPHDKASKEPLCKAENVLFYNNSIVLPIPKEVKP